MKKTLLCVFAAVCLAAAFASCASNTYTTVWFEDMAHVEKAIPFKMKTLPNAGDAVAYGVMDGSLCDVRYNITDEYDRPASLSFRMAEPDYVEKLNSSGKGSFTGMEDKPSTSERLGSATVIYHCEGSKVTAQWELGGYAYAIILEFTDGSAAVTDDIRDHVLSVISMGVK